MKMLNYAYSFNTNAFFIEKKTAMKWCVRK